MQKAVTENTGAMLTTLYKEIRLAQGKTPAGDTRMQAIYDQEGNTVRGPEMRQEVARQGEEINRKTTTDMQALNELLEWTKPTTTAHSGDTELSDEERTQKHITWLNFKLAMHKTQPNKAVGCDGFDPYLLKLATEEVQQEWLRIITGMVNNRDYPHEFNNWYCMLLSKGEDELDLSRKRDIWLAPGSQKILTRMLIPEYDRVARITVPNSQAAFTTAETREN